MNKYLVIKENELKKHKQYMWFSTFSNPCYGFDVKMDVTKLVEYTKETKTSFFINTLYLVTKGLSMVEEMRLRLVNNEIRLYEKINPSFTVMTKSGMFENCNFEYAEDYIEFYKRAKKVIESAKQQETVKEIYNESTIFDEYYITCIPWLSFESMSNPLPNNNSESSSVPRICWDKYRVENDKTIMTLNITVSHAFVDGLPLSQAFHNIQDLFDDAYAQLK